MKSYTLLNSELLHAKIIRYLPNYPQSLIIKARLPFEEVTIRLEITLRSLTTTNLAILETSRLGGSNHASHEA